MLLPCVGRNSPDLKDNHPELKEIPDELSDTFDSRIAVPKLVVSGTNDLSPVSSWEFVDRTRVSTTGPWLVRPGEKLARGTGLGTHSDNRTPYQRTRCIIPSPYSPIDEDNVSE